MWRAYVEAELVTERRFANISVTLFNCHRDKGEHPAMYTLQDLYPHLTESAGGGIYHQEETPDQTVARMKAYAASLPAEFRGRRHNNGQ